MIATMSSQNADRLASRTLALAVLQEYRHIHTVDHLVRAMVIRTETRSHKVRQCEREVFTAVATELLSCS